jgi:hypothetical protein
MLDVRESVSGRHRRQWITRQARGLKGRVIRAVLTRVATPEMRHAALLLGYDIALGHGREGIFRYLDEFDIGTEIGRSVRYGKPEEREGAVETLILELCLFS